MAATTNGHTNGTANGTTPRIHLYTNHGCPYAHRAHITLQELGIPFEETIIDLTTPRPQWYLDINPRGLVPAIKYTVPGVMTEEIIYESQIVAQFFCDTYPSHLLPSTSDPLGPLKRARINFFIDNWNTKVASGQMTMIKAAPEEREAKVQEWIATIGKELDPLLADAAPFFGGSKELTFAEVHAAPFVLRWFAMADDGEVIPKSFKQGLEKLPNFGKWAKRVIEHPSVLQIWDEKSFIESFKARIAKMQAAAK